MTAALLEGRQCSSLHVSTSSPSSRTRHRSWSQASSSSAPLQLRCPASRSASSVRVNSTVYNDPQVVPPPPPPPPPPPAPQESRRNVLLYAGGAVAAVAGLAAVVSRGSSNDPSAAGLDPQEKASIDALRDEAGFRRNYDGHVQLLARNGDPVEVRLDAKVPGTVLLRDRDGYVYFITINNIQQIDLTDDYVLMALFGDGAWEDSMQRLTAKDDNGNLVEVIMDQDTFRDMISVME